MQTKPRFLGRTACSLFTILELSLPFYNHNKKKSFCLLNYAGSSMKFLYIFK
jgi:hypothetical protein